MRDLVLAVRGLTGKLDEVPHVPDVLAHDPDHPNVTEVLEGIGRGLHRLADVLERALVRVEFAGEKTPGEASVTATEGLAGK
jgi:hypothetical protein